MCTYNGAAFLAEQLESIAKQRLPPDELIVCDDGSIDNSVAIVQEFSMASPFPVHIRTNATNLGYAKNFEQAISLCSGEIVALSDQDDAWDPDRLWAGAGLLRDRPEIGLVCSDADIVDRDLGPLGIRMKELLGFGHADQALVAKGEAPRVLVRRNFVMGATVAFRSSFIPDIAPIPESWVHDGWIGLVVALRAQVAFIDEPLVHYRQHGGNQVGAPTRRRLGDLLSGAMPPRATLRNEAEKWRVARERAGMANSSDLRLLLEKERHARKRAMLPNPRLARVPHVLGELMSCGYHRYSAGSGSVQRLLMPREA